VIYAVCKEQKDEKQRAARSTKAASSVYKTIFFTLSSYFGYFVLKDEPFFDVLIGGKGDTMMMFKDYPTYKHPEYYVEYYLFLLGYHLSQTLIHLSEIRHPKSDFADMILHHFLTIGLISLSYLTNYSTFGMVILFLHDLSDVPGMVTKVFSETIYTKTAVTAFLICIVMWFYLRLLYFPYVIYVLLTTKPVTPFNMSETFAFFLSLLVVLHYYWFNMFMKILLFYKRKGDADDCVTHVNPEAAKAMMGKKD
jgi:hypothetical protein